MKKYLFSALMIVLATFISMGPISPVMAEESIGMVTGSKTGTYFRFGNEIADIAKKAGLDITVKTSKGSLDNILRIDSSENAAFAMVQSDVLGFLSRSDKPEVKRTAKKLRLIFPFYNEEVHLFARKEIQQIKDLQGKRVILGAGGSGNFITATNLLNIMEIRPAQELTHLDPSKAVEAILMGEADAMFYVAGKPVKLFSNLANLKSDPGYASLLETVHIVPLNDPKMLNEYVSTEITSQDYAWISQTIPTIAVKAILICFDFSSKHNAYYRTRCGQLARLGRVMRDHLHELKLNGHPKWKEVNLENGAGIWEMDACSRTSVPAPADTPDVPDARGNRFRDELRRIIEKE